MSDILYQILNSCIVLCFDLISESLNAWDLDLVRSHQPFLSLPCLLYPHSVLSDCILHLFKGEPESQFLCDVGPPDCVDLPDQVLLLCLLNQEIVIPIFFTSTAAVLSIVYHHV